MYMFTYIYMHIHGQTFKANGPWLINEEIWKVMVGWYFESWPDDLRNVGSQITNDGKDTTIITTVTVIIIVINIVVTNIHLIPTNNYHHIHPHNTKLEVKYYDGGGRQNYHNHHCHNKYYHHHHHNHHDHHDQLAPWPDDL